MNNNSDKKRRYYVIEAKDMIKPVFENDQSNPNNIVRVGEESIASTFEEYGIPTELQKVIIKINSLSYGIPRFEEYITRLEFQPIGKVRSEDHKHDILCGEALTEAPHSDFNFSTILKTSNYKDIIKFYKELQDQGLLESYLNSLLAFFERVAIMQNISTKIEDYTLSKKRQRFNFLDK